MTDALKNQFYQWIADQKRGLDALYPWVDMIDCNENTKNDAPQHVLDNYTLALEDVFKGQTQLDASKWNTSLPWGPGIVINDEEQYYVDILGGVGPQPGDAPSSPYPNPPSNPFSFGPDGLIIEAAPWDTNTDRSYTSGVITSRDSLCFTGGYTEICMKPPCNADGSWPAAWLLNCMYYNDADAKNAAEGATNDKFNPEIDWPEFVTGGGNSGTVCAKPAYHYFTGARNDPNNYSQWDLDTNNFTQKDGNTFALQSQFNVYQDCAGANQFQLPEVCETDYCNDFHTYGIDWCPNDYIHFYLDGQLKRCIDGADNIISDQAMYFIVNFAVGGSFPFGGLPGGTASNNADPNDYPAQLEVEYVRIYTK